MRHWTSSRAPLAGADVAKEIIRCAEARHAEAPAQPPWATANAPRRRPEPRQAEPARSKAELPDG